MAVAAYGTASRWVTPAGSATTGCTTRCTLASAKPRFPHPPCNPWFQPITVPSMRLTKRRPADARLVMFRSPTNTSEPLAWTASTLTKYLTLMSARPWLKLVADCRFLSRGQSRILGVFSSFDRARKWGRPHQGPQAPWFLRWWTTPSWGNSRFGRWPTSRSRGQPVSCC